MTPEEIADLRQQRYNATITSLEKLHSDLLVMRIESDFPRPQYLAGQYCTLGLGNWEPRVDGCQTENLKPEDLSKIVRRSYSISSSIYREPGELRDVTKDRFLEFYIVLVRENADGGRVPALTPRLFATKAGDRIQIGEKIVGHFNLEPVQQGDNVIFLGTGTGEAPHNSMANELLLNRHTGRILNVACVRFSKDLGYYSTHQQLMKDYLNYKYIGLTTREASNGKKVYIQDAITSGELEDTLGDKLDPARTHVFLCGNPKMIGIPVKNKETGELEYPQPVGVIEILERMGFKADNAATKTHGNIHFEKYW